MSDSESGTEEYSDFDYTSEEYDSEEDYNDGFEFSEKKEEPKRERSPSPDLPSRSLTDAEKAFIGNSSPFAISRIMKDRKQIAKNPSYNEIFEIDFLGDNIHIWNLLMRFPKEEKIQKDLDEYSKFSDGKHPNAIKMEITFPSDFPMAPPFMRVVSPKFKYRTARVTVGGSICTELLTSSGWAPTYSVGQALIQIQSEIMEGKPELEPYNKYMPAEYSMKEAMDAFMRKARQMGWEK